MERVRPGAGPPPREAHPLRCAPVSLLHSCFRTGPASVETSDYPARSARLETRSLSCGVLLSVQFAPADAGGHVSLAAHQPGSREAVGAGPRCWPLPRCSRCADKDNVRDVGNMAQAQHGSVTKLLQKPAPFDLGEEPRDARRVACGEWQCQARVMCRYQTVTIEHMSIGSDVLKRRRRPNGNTPV